MMQTILVVVMVVGAVGWLGWYGYRFIKPKAGAKGCGGGCGCGHENAGNQPSPAAEGVNRPKTVFLPSEDLVARLKARR